MPVRPGSPIHRPAPDFVESIEVLHHLYEPEHRTDNSHRGREASGGLKYLRKPFLAFEFVVELKLGNFAQLLRFCAIDRQSKHFFHEWVLHLGEFIIKGGDPTAAGHVRIIDQLFDHSLKAGLGFGKNPCQAPDCGQHN